ncbi:MAG: transglycosylase domain-containing protein, partial [Rickettsiales bacterium]|nr:transglycosylase domain-containing protein [Rickettsiales bacterium]
MIWAVIGLVIFIFYCSVDLPDVLPMLESKSININILYSDNRLMKRYGDYSAEINNYAEFPLHLVDALIATEDRRFFKHHGFNYFSIIRALFVNLRAGYIKQGGSTITQQLAKFILRNNKKTIKRKIQELLLSFQLENKLTKEEILVLYFNKAYFGAGKYGIKSASQFYFGKSVADLNLEEGAMLVGLLKAPSRYTPQNNPELSAQRTKQVILNMKDAGINIKLKENENVIDSATKNSTNKPDEYLYFSDWVRAQITDYASGADIIVKTTLDYKVQNAIEKAVADSKIKKQLAVIALGEDGDILGMAGGNNYHRSEFNRAVYGNRQSGSCFKLFVYLSGMINKQYEPNTIFKDEPVAVGSWFPE